MLRQKLISLFIAISSISFSVSVFADQNLKNELDAGKAIVLVINAIAEPETEQYADWSHYLNQFSSKAGETFVFHKTTTRKLKDQIYGAEKFSTNHSMIFMKKGKPSYFYNGPIVEPQVYQFVYLTYQEKPVKPEYLKQFAPQVITIKFKQ